MLLEIPLYAEKNAQIMLDSQSSAILVSENALFNFKQNVETQALCVYQQLNKVKCLIVCLWNFWFSQNLSNDKQLINVRSP